MLKVLYYCFSLLEGIIVGGGLLVSEELLKWIYIFFRKIIEGVKYYCKVNLRWGWYGGWYIIILY